MNAINRGKIVVFGATGTIGKAVVAALLPKYELLQVGNRRGDFKADITDRNSIRNVFQNVGKVDHIVSATGAARFLPFEKLTDEDFRFGLANKLMGQVNLVRIGLDYLNDNGSITLTSGILARHPVKGRPLSAWLTPRWRDSSAPLHSKRQEAFAL